MSDFRRGETQAMAAAAAADRESRAEALLIEGLDRYFSGHYEDAIHLWTRVLFLDRSHARARAYIDRARTALGERQRRAEEMVHSAGSLLAEGQLEQARRLLRTAEETSGADEKVAELWTRIERVERTRVGVPVQSAAPAAIVDALPLHSWRHAARSAMQMGGAAAFGALLVTAVTSPAVRDWVTGNSVSQPAAVATGQPLPILTSSEAALVRARTLYARGRLAEALRALDQVEPGDGDRAAIDALRVDIQRWLLLPRRSIPASTPEDPGGSAR